MERIEQTIKHFEIKIDELQNKLNDDGDTIPMNRNKIKDEIISYQRQIILWYRLLSAIQKRRITRLGNNNL